MLASLAGRAAGATHRPNVWREPLYPRRSPGNSASEPSISRQTGPKSNVEHFLVASQQVDDLIVRGVFVDARTVGDISVMPTNSEIPVLLRKHSDEHAVLLQRHISVEQ